MLLRLLAGFGFLGINVVLGSQFSLDFLVTDEFAQMPFHYKLAYVFVLGKVLRALFYIAWMFIEATMIACGFAYDEERKTWDKIKAVDVISFELATTPATQMRDWNH